MFEIVITLAISLAISLPAMFVTHKWVTNFNARVEAEAKAKAEAEAKAEARRLAAFDARAKAATDRYEQSLVAKAAVARSRAKVTFSA